MDYPNLLSSLKIGNLVFSNRIVMPPMVTNLAENNGLSTKAQEDHYARSSGPGFVIVEATAVLPEGRISNRQLGIYSDRHIEGLARLARLIHAGGAVAGIQIHHAGTAAFMGAKQKRIIALMKKLYRFGRQQLMYSGLKRICNAFKVASRRAVEAGFDVIEIHGAHGYLFSQFLSPAKNYRIDRYGGVLENRSRLLLEVYRAVSSEVDEKAVVTCRLGIADRHTWGLKMKDGVATALKLQSEGVKILDVSSGNGSFPNIRAKEMPYSETLYLAQAAKTALTIPVIGGGGVRHPDLAEKALEDKMADFIYIGRGILADPAWAKKTIAGKPESIVFCLGCRPCSFHTNPSMCPARSKSSN